MSNMSFRKDDFVLLKSGKEGKGSMMNVSSFGGKVLLNFLLVFNSYFWETYYRILVGLTFFNIA